MPKSVPKRRVEREDEDVEDESQDETAKSRKPHVKRSRNKSRSRSAASSTSPSIESSSNHSDSSKSSTSSSDSDSSRIAAKRRHHPRKKIKQQEHCRHLSSSDDDGASSASEEVDAFEFPVAPKREIERLLAIRDTPGNIKEYFVKWRHRAYKHCSWVPIAEVDDGSRAAKLRLARFRPVDDDEEPFDKAFLQPERIVAETFPDAPTTGTTVERLLLVKWRKLSWADCTWEPAEELRNGADLVRQFDARIAASQRPQQPWNGERGSFVQLEESPHFRGGHTLRAYQLQGLNWLVDGWCAKRNAILADEMGLGKTAQTLATLEHLHAERGVPGPFLVVAPLSTLAQWKRESESWTSMNSLLFHGRAAERRIIVKYEFFRTAQGINDAELFGKQDSINPLKFDLLITSYETFRAEIALLKKIHWRFLVADEAHRLKNIASKMLEVMKLIDTEHKLLLTGTPVQNNTAELFSLLQFLDPAQFASPDAFMAQFGELHEAVQVERLQALLQPLMLRRLKESVEQSIAPKEETIIEVELTTLQKKYYRAIYERNRSFLGGSGKKTGGGAVMPSLTNVVMQLRKCCNHPYLISGVEETATATLDTEEQLKQQLINASGKLVLVDKLLSKLRATGHKVLIFSQMTRVLDILEEYLDYRGYTYERIDGSIQGEERQAAIDRYCAPDSDRFVFLLCTRAGGLGINLQVADTVVIYDSDWNPQNDVQAQARCHRIGQTKDVKVYRLITRNTYERYMFDRASKKLGLEQAILCSMRSSTPTPVSVTPSETPTGEEHSTQMMPAQKHMSRHEIDAVLKYGAYGLLEDDEASKRFVEADIDKILEAAVTTTTTSTTAPLTPSTTPPTISRPSETVAGTVAMVDSTAVTPALILPTFTKAMFCSDGARPEIDMNDPDFWQKVLAELPHEDRDDEEDEMTHPRQRRAAQRYHPHDSHHHHHVYLSDTDEVGSSDSAAESGSDGADGQQQQQQQKIAMDGRRRWNQLDRQKMKLALMSLGWGRWDDIRQKSFPHHTNEEVEAFAAALVAKCIPLVDAVLARNSVLKFAGIDLSQRGFPGDETQVVTSAMLRPEGESSAHCYDDDPVLCSEKFKLHLVQHGAVIFSRMVMCSQVAMALKNWDDIVPGLHSCPFTGWSSEQDHDLLVGCFRHGLKNFDAIFADDTLGFKTKFRPNAAEVGLASTMITPIPQATIEANTADGAATVSPAPTLHSEMAQLHTELPEMPKRYQIGWRLRKLLSIANSESGGVKEAEVAENSAVATTTGTSHKIASTTMLSVVWSRREKQDFYRSLVLHGLPMNAAGEPLWEELRASANLTRKTAEMVRDYFSDFQAQCTILVKQQSTQKLKRQQQQQEAMDSTGPAPAPTPDGEEPQAADSAAGAQETTTDISQTQCRKVVQRLQMFARLRTKVVPLSEEKLDSILARSERWLRLPHWWRVPDHDRGLIRAVLKHGLGAWGTTFADESLPFHAVLKSLSKQPETATASETTDATTGPMSMASLLSDSPRPAAAATAAAASTVVAAEVISMENKELDLPREGIVLERLNYLIDLCIASSVWVSEPTYATAQQPKTAIVESLNALSQPKTRAPRQRKKSRTPQPQPLQQQQIFSGTNGSHDDLRWKIYTPSSTSQKQQQLHHQQQQAPEPSFPMRLDEYLVIKSIGTVIPGRPRFHSEQYHWPLGFLSERTFLSTVAIQKPCVYSCTVLASSDGSSPIFVVTAQDLPTGAPFVGDTPTKAWEEPLRLINMRRVSHGLAALPPAMSGEDLFGIAHPVVAQLLQGQRQTSSPLLPRPRTIAPPPQPQSTASSMSLLIPMHVRSTPMTAKTMAIASLLSTDAPQPSLSIGSSSFPAHPPAPTLSFAQQFLQSPPQGVAPQMLFSFPPSSSSTQH